MIYLICVLLSFSSQSINYVIMNFLNAITSSNLDLEAFELFVNDILIPIREAILTYIIFDTIMGNENRKQDKIEDMNVKKDREKRIIKYNAMTKYQLYSRWHKKKRKYTPYNFDEKKEYKIYNNIGERYRKEFVGEKTKVNEKYPDFDKYLEWEKYFTVKFLNGDNNDCNFLHYLNRKLRIQKRCVELYKTVAVPIYIMMVSATISMYSSKNYPILSLNEMLIIGIIIILVSSLYSTHVYTAKKCFYEDCIKVIENLDTSHQK